MRLVLGLFATGTGDGLLNPNLEAKALGCRLEITVEASVGPRLFLTGLGLEIGGQILEAT